MKNSYKIIIISGLGILLIGGLFYWLLPKPEAKNEAPAQLSPDGSLESLEFMAVNEKEAFGLPAEARVQVISREKDGGISVYKIIRSDQDVVSNPSQLAPFSPRE